MSVKVERRRDGMQVNKEDGKAGTGSTSLWTVRFKDRHSVNQFVDFLNVYFKNLWGDITKLEDGAYEFQWKVKCRESIPLPPEWDKINPPEMIQTFFETGKTPLGDRRMNPEWLAGLEGFVRRVVAVSAQVAKDKVKDTLE